MLSIWLGNRESQRPVLEMKKAVSEGKLIELMASSDKAMQLSAVADTEDHRIGDELLQVQGGIGLITVKGALVSEYRWYNSLFGVVSYDEIRDAFSMAAEDPNVKSILLNVESGGGTPTNLDDTSEYIRKIDANIKPVYGHVTSHAYSAGYWLLSSVRKITASKMASVGSVGVIMTHVTYAKMYQDAGIEYTYLRSGKFKALGQDGEEFSDDAKAVYLDQVMQLFKFFEDQVVTARGSVAASNKSKWNEGKTFFAKEAVSLGLADDINSFDGHISKLYDTSNIHFGAGLPEIELKAIGDIAMKLKLLSTEQAAKFASGVPLENLGLSDSDLEKTKAELEAALEEDVSEEEANLEEGGADTVDASEEVSSEEEGAAAVDAKSVDKLIELSSKLAKTEVSLEASETKIAEMSEKINALATLQEQLMTIAAEATGRLQVALGKAASDFTSASAENIISQYNAEKKVLFGSLPTGATSEQTVNDRSEEDNLSLQQKAEHTIIKLGDK